MRRVYPTVRYDAFISYRHGEPDRSWVRQVLGPALEARALHICIDYRCFRVAAPIVLEMERAVVQSRYTIAVMTPPYLESSFVELENVLADHLGLELRQRRLIAVMREHCVPPLRIRARVFLDMTDDTMLEKSLVTLADVIRSPP